MYGFSEKQSKKRIRNWHVLVWNSLRIWESGWHTHIKKSNLREEECFFASAKEESAYSLDNSYISIPGELRVVSRVFQTIQFLIVVRQLSSRRIASLRRCQGRSRKEKGVSKPFFAVRNTEYQERVTKVDISCSSLFRLIHSKFCFFYCTLSIWKTQKALRGSLGRAAAEAFKPWYPV